MPDEQNVERILEYLRENYPRYDLESLRRQLVLSGQAAEDISEAEVRLRRERGEPAPITGPLEGPPVAPAKTATEPAIPAPAPSATDEREIQHIVAYLSQYRNHYPIDLLRQQVLDAGRPAALVDEALGRLNTAPATPPDQRKAWPIGCAVGFGNLFAIIMIWVIIVGAIGSLELRDNAILWLGLGASLLIPLGELIAGVALLRSYWGRVLLLGVFFWLVITGIGGIVAGLLFGLGALLFGPGGW